MNGGGDLFEYAISLGYEFVEDECGQAILGTPSDSKLAYPLSIPYQQAISDRHRDIILGKMGKTLDDYQRFVNRKNKRGSTSPQ